MFYLVDGDEFGSDRGEQVRRGQWGKWEEKQASELEGREKEEEGLVRTKDVWYTKESTLQSFSNLFLIIHRGNFFN